jgi:hypothetical protein
VRNSRKLLSKSEYKKTLDTRAKMFEVFRINMLVVGAFFLAVC